MNNGNNMNGENRRAGGSAGNQRPRRAPSADDLLRDTENRAAGQRPASPQMQQRHDSPARRPGAAPQQHPASHAQRPASPQTQQRPVAPAQRPSSPQAGRSSVPVRSAGANPVQRQAGSLRPAADSSAPPRPAEPQHPVVDTATKRTAVTDKAKSEKKKDNTPALVNLLRSIVYIVVIVVISALISIFVINMGNDIFAFVKSDETIEVEIPDNPDVGDIADVLYDNGVIKYPSMFKMYAKVKKKDSGFLTDNKDKVFSVSPSMNYDQLLGSFKEQIDNSRTWITIPEGYTVDEIIDLMLSYGIGGSKEEYVDVINNGKFDYWFVKELEDSGWSQHRYYRLEGYLFPDTYEFYIKSSAYTVVNKLLARFDQVYVDDYKTQAEKLGLTTDQVVILASLIEKEAGNAADYRNVSSVFHNRLRNPTTYPYLDSDATIMYAIQHDTGERPKTLENTDYASPYNTYKNKGYPPGPIANPSASALRFAISPAETRYYYFYSGRGGYTYFAATYAEHQRNIEMAKSGIINEE